MLTLEKLIEFIAEQLDKDAAEINADTTLESLGIDSLGTVELVMNLEDVIGMEIELDEKLLTVGEFCAFVQKKQQAQA
ncbi:MAG: acyl carrier protein [Firmicutes bacterium]|nr:acyl carrier protein [Bacillota bacterium]